MKRGSHLGAATAPGIVVLIGSALALFAALPGAAQQEPEPSEAELATAFLEDELEAEELEEQPAEEDSDLTEEDEIDPEDDPNAGIITPDFADSFPESSGEEMLPIESEGTLRTVVGAARLLTYPAQIARLAMANDNIARVQVISGREVLLTPMKPGRTTLFVWLAGGRRLRYVFQVDPDVELAEIVLRDIHPDIELEAKGAVVILRGEVSDKTAEQAVNRVRSLIKNVRVIDLMSSLLEDASPDERLRAALEEIDERIEVRRIQVGPEPQPDKDTYILEGRVKSVSDLVQAMTVAERQLGDTEIGVVPVEGGQELALRGFAEGESPVGLAALISRGLDLMSPSGRVISFLEVDELPQILVRVKVMEIDRGKFRNLGLDFDLGTLVGSGSLSVPPLIGAPGVPIDFVDNTLSISAFIDFLETKSLARSVVEPTVLTLSGEQASIVVGGQIPIPTTSIGNVSTVQGFRFQEFGVSLSIRPTLIESDIIALDVAPSISRPTGNVGGNNNVPSFSFQTVRTSARLHAGQSLVIGGLLSFNETLDQTNLPWLRKLPIFNSKRRSRAETELLFVITPRFISIDPAEPVPPLPTVDPDQLVLGELDWSHDRNKWSNPFEPQEMWPDGVPPSLRRVVPGPVRPLEDDRAQEVELAPDVDLASAIQLGIGGESEDAAADEPEPPEPVAPVAEVRWVSEEATPCLNLRPEATRWFTPRDCLPPGTRVLVFGEEDGWSRVVVPSGQEGWVATRFLTDAGAED